MTDEPDRLARALQATQDRGRTRAIRALNSLGVGETDIWSSERVVDFVLDAFNDPQWDTRADLDYL